MIKVQDKGTSKYLRGRVKDLFVLSDGNLGVLFDRKTLSLRKLSLDMAKVFGQIIEGVDTLPDCSQSWVSIDEIIEQITRVPSYIFDEDTHGSPLKSESSSKTSSDRFLARLAINIADNCNLNCVYCYANKGFYGANQSRFLDHNKVETIITQFVQRFDVIRHVQFMGGEPSLNPKAIQRVCDTFSMLVSEGKLSQLPKYSLVTNAVRFSPQFINVVKQHKISLTVSLDGPKEIHDYLRMKKNGKGSYDTIRRNISLALDAGIKISYEATFTKRHIESGFSLIDLCLWFYEELGERILHAPLVSKNRYGLSDLVLSDQEAILQYCAVTEWGIDNLIEHGFYLMHSSTARLLKSFKSKVGNSNICPAGNSLLAVSTDGEVYPCWMFVDEQAMRLGNVDDIEFLGQRSKDVLSEFQQYDLYNRAECRQCWVQPLCFGCVANDFYATSALNVRTECEHLKTMAATFIIRLFDPSPIIPVSAKDYVSQRALEKKSWSLNNHQIFSSYSF